MPLTFRLALLAAFLSGWCVAPAGATIIHSAAGLSAKNVPVEFEARLSIVGDTLTIVLNNKSPVFSLNPDDVLGSYYFDIVDAGNNRPTLTYASAIGDVFLAHRNNSDTLSAAAADLMAVNPGDYTWQYKVMDHTLTPFMGFGIGTVGNSNLNPNGFSGNIVDGIDFSIFRGEVTTSNLHNRLLVKDTATFSFTGVSGFTEADISTRFAFGLGTAPDSLLPEPASALLLGVGACAMLRRRH